MKIFYPYPEILPLRKAHDAYVVRQCAALADAGLSVTLICGKGSLSKQELFDFYGIRSDNALKIVFLPILRRQYFLPVQWNRLFFLLTQRYLRKYRPDGVIFSVEKQGAYHIKRRIPGIFYVYEVHQLHFYPNADDTKKREKATLREREIFRPYSLLITTTRALENILRSPPYSLTVPVRTVPLACDFPSLPERITSSERIHLAYVGQLYKEQGLDFLLRGLQKIEGVTLTVIGGTSSEVEVWKKRVADSGESDRIFFRGFLPLKEINRHLRDVDAFVTTFEDSGRMPYVAHTKLAEYLHWGRPIIAPRFPVTAEHLQKGTVFYLPNDEESFIEALRKMKDPFFRRQLQKEIFDQKKFFWKDRGEEMHRLFLRDCSIKK